MKKKIGITRFPGTNCDQDVWKAVESAGGEPRWLWHQDKFDVNECEAILIPGGFSFGDYLRAGALAARSPVMASVRDAAQKGIPILGICNGFQILCESGLLPGVLVQNEQRRFVDQWVELKLENPHSYWASRSPNSIRLPVAHGQGRFYIDEKEMKSLRDEGHVWWSYEASPNGSWIAGIHRGSVAALMPHPERAMAEWMGSHDGQSFFAFE